MPPDTHPTTSGPATGVVKLYRYNSKERSYYYDEAWVADGHVIEHVGKLGTTGRTTTHDLTPGISDLKNVMRVLQPGLKGGYATIPREHHFTLLIEYAIRDFGTTDDLRKRHALEERMNETLGWTGLGHCDGGSFGPDTMAVCCLVVDFDLARRIVVSDLEGTQFADYARIYDEDA
jgi:hypothetical protein